MPVTTSAPAQKSKVGPDYCWCMPYRNMKEGGDRNEKSDKKVTPKHYVDTNIPVGLLYYEDSKPVAWCSIVPRKTYNDFFLRWCCHQRVVTSDSQPL
jgi:hypothetical protein